ncbi:unnamed protein product [Rotaria sp. Silwood1]|nr:unnamed protein product [Rotaria sp. Silwood1]CAF5016559.1 unnamed protein product [Rotaria sp. Silwood1]
MVGNDARNKHILDRTFICSVCSFILHDPLQLTECGHRLCQSCFNVEQETTIKCRQCQLETLRINVRPDRGFKNDMQSLPIDCSFLDAQSKRQISIDSPLFYSSPTGYKMRARLYLNGYGNAHCTHMSAFFVLMRGLNDPILKFPFTYKVVFCLYDQSFAKQHIIDSFRPDIGVSGFQRPRLDMNIVSGISKFVPLTKIQQENSPYIRDDTMFIKIMLDFNDIPNISLPIAMSLNPGLPIHVQHMMIEQEMKQRSEQQSQYSNETKEIKLSCEETAQ